MTNLEITWEGRVICKGEVKDREFGKKGREACEEGEGKIFTCKTQQILYLDENETRKSLIWNVNPGWMELD